MLNDHPVMATIAVRDLPTAAAFYQDLLPLLLCLAVAACIPVPLHPGQPGTRTGPTERSPNDLEVEVHERVNRRRTSMGLPALTLDPTLSALARQHSAAMAAGGVPFGHDGFESRASTAQSRLGVSRMAENVEVS